MNKVIIVDASESDRRLMSGLLVKHGYEPIAVESMEAAKEEVAKLPPGAVVVTAMKFAHGTAQELVSWQKHEGYKFPVVAVVDNLNPLEIADVMKDGGAVDIIQRPAIDKQLTETVRKYIKEVDPASPDHKLIHRPSKEFERIEREITRIASTEANVIILGESGMGKEQIAREIFNQSNRTDKPLIIIEAGGAALVGEHNPGSEKSEMYNRIVGYFKKAAGGTIILKNVHLLNFDKQSVILHILSEEHPDVRVICTAEPELLELVSNKTFRSNLFFNLREIDITVNPLRKVTEDIQPIAEFYLTQYAEEHHQPVKRFDASAIKMLKHHNWPGNIRELKNVIQLAAGNVSGEVITSSHLSISRSSPEVSDSLLLRDPKAEKQRIVEALTKSDGIISQAAKLLGVSRITLANKMKIYGLK
ncbi:regulatory protein AtoC [Muribaculaceae bacterium]|nr:regulatory protein AtoC [Muribaculaceae bacterium]